MVQVQQGEKGHGAALIAQRVAEGGAGGEQRAGWELLQQHLHPQTSPQFSNHESLLNGYAMKRLLPSPLLNMPANLVLS